MKFSRFGLFCAFGTLAVLGVSCSSIQKAPDQQDAVVASASGPSNTLKSGNSAHMVKRGLASDPAAGDPGAGDPGVGYCPSGTKLYKQSAQSAFTDRASIHEGDTTPFPASCAWLRNAGTLRAATVKSNHAFLEVTLRAECPNPTKKTFKADVFGQDGTVDYNCFKFGSYGPGHSPWVQSVGSSYSTIVACCDPGPVQECVTDPAPIAQ